MGSVAFSWVLSNNTVDSGAVNQPYPLTPDRLLFIPPTDELWLAFDAPPTGEPYNTSVVNLSNRATDVLAGVGNVTGLLFDPGVGAVFVAQVPASGAGGQLLAFGVASHELVRTPIAIGPHPTSIALANVTGDIWVTGWTNSTAPGELSIVSHATGRISRVVPVGLDPTAVAFDPALGLAYVANSGSTNLSVLSATNGSAVGSPVSLPGSVMPGALAFDPTTGDLVALVQIGSVPSTSLVTLDPATGAVADLGPLPGNATASTIAIDPATGDAYVATEQVHGSSAGGGELLRCSFALSSWTAVAPVGRNPDVQWLDPVTQQDFVGHTGQSYVSVVNVSGGVGIPTLLEFGGGPQGGTYDPSDGRVYVVNSFLGGTAGTAPDVLEAIDPATGASAQVVAPEPPGTTSLGAELAGVAVDPSSSRLFVPERADSSAVVLLSTNGGYFARLPLRFAPATVADDPVRGIVYFASSTGEVDGFVAQTFGGNFSLADSWNLTPPTTALNASFQGLAFDPSSGVLVLLTPDLSATGVSGAWILDTANGSERFVPLGAPGSGASGDYPTAVVFDPADGDFYIARTGGTVDVLNLTSGTVVANATVGVRPTYLAFDAKPLDVILADGAAGEIRLLNASVAASVGTGVVSVAVGPNPDGLVVDPVRHKLVVSDYGSATLDVFSATPQVGSLTVHVTIPTVGEEPGSTSVDDVGRPVLLDALAGGGSGPLRFAYTGLPPGCVTANTSHLFCQPTGPGYFPLEVNATDAVGQSAVADADLTVVPAPSLSASAAPNPVDGSGADVTVAGTVAGGGGPFRYAIGFGDGSTPIEGSASTRTFSATHHYAVSGTYSATLSITDSFGATNATTIAVVIGTPLSGSASATSTSIGGPEFSVNFTAEVRGGVAPFTFVWVFTGIASGVPRTVVGSPGRNESSTLQAFSHSGAETVEVWVNDSAHGTLRLFDNTTVGGPPNRAPPAPVLWLVVAGGVGVAAAIAVALVWRSHRRRAAARRPDG